MMKIKQTLTLWKVRNFPTRIYLKNPHSPIFFQLAKFGIVFNANSNDINVSVNKKAKKGYFVFNNIFCQATHLQMHLQFRYLSLSLKKPKRKWVGSMCYDL